MKKLYFAGSITGGRADAALYQYITEHAHSLGWTVLTEHVSNANLSEKGEEYPVDYIYARDLAWIREADVVLAEVTTPSLGVGYEVAIAETLNKPILRLFQPASGRRLSAMIAGNPDAHIAEYATLEDMRHQVTAFLNQYTKG